LNPQGVETQYFFEYGLESSYGNKTVPTSAGAANAEHEVRSEPQPLEKGWHLRVVAFNDAGTSYGADATVTDDPITGALPPDDSDGSDTGTAPTGTMLRAETESRGSETGTMAGPKKETGSGASGSEQETIDDSEADTDGSETGITSDKETPETREETIDGSKPEIGEPGTETN